MANINGEIQKRVTLTANEETIIQFTHSVQNIALFASGGTVYFKANGSISGISDLSANFLDDGETFDMYKNVPINQLHLLSSSSAVVQWDTPLEVG